MGVSVEVDGRTPDGVFDVREGRRRGDRLSTATVECAATPGNIGAIGSGDDMRIERNGLVTFSGVVVGKPSRSTDGTMEVEGTDKRRLLKGRTVSRTFHRVDSGAAVEKAVSERAEAGDPVVAHRGEPSGAWSSDFDVFERYGGTNASMWEYGSDMMFAGARAGASGEYHATRSGVPAAAYGGDGGGVEELVTRMVANNRGQVMSCEVELGDPSGGSYTWALGLGSGGFREHRLKAEETLDREPSDACGGSPVIQYRFSIDGSLPEDRGIFIDGAETVPYSVSDSNVPVTTNNVERTGRLITRRVDRSALEFIDEVGAEDGYASWVDAEDDLHYEGADRGRRGDRPIVRGETPVLTADFDRDATRVNNKVTVRGAGDISVSLENPASVDFYGPAPRGEPLVDETLQSEADARARGEAFLEENAWNETIADFDVGDTDYADLRPGERIEVDWPPQGVSGVFAVNSRSMDSSGVVNVAVAAGAA